MATLGNKQCSYEWCQLLTKNKRKPCHREDCFGRGLCVDGGSAQQALWVAFREDFYAKEVCVLEEVSDILLEVFTALVPGAAVLIL